MREEANILIGITGSISVLSLPTYLGAIKHNFGNVKVIMSESASKMLPSSTISLFCDDVMVTSEDELQNKYNHVQLARWADLFIILPATANTIGQAAHGLAPDLLLSTILAHHHPVIFYPNMNKLMWEKASLQRNIDYLKEDGHMVVQPEEKSAYEVASGTIKTNFIIPDVPSILKDLKSELHNRKSF
ncbi:flavoprotein [Guptibacillus hwajinpoensis]|uniref:Mersacidin decarboxylase n=1 Tax=Guptibacillus hwajinpoensis TaxID=208199 RepID=A0A0J6CUM3_9BACL|nr:flavoprotein [Alkalihalobacillus macyae]KMM36765.1 Mersacidin decarboxylase [Alkalihalobacillus macyae]